MGGGEGITIVSGPGGGGSFEPPDTPPPGYGPISYLCQSDYRLPCTAHRKCKIDFSFKVHQMARCKNPNAGFPRKSQK